MGLHIVHALLLNVCGWQVTITSETPVCFTQEVCAHRGQMQEGTYNGHR